MSPLLLLLLLVGPAEADTLVTCGTKEPPGCIPTLQAAVDAAVDGDDIQVNSGVYPESVVIEDRVLTLKGQVDTARAAVVGSGVAGDGPVLTIRGPAASVVVNELLIASSDVLPLDVSGGADVSLRGCLLQGGALRDRGGVVQLTDSSLFIEWSHLVGGRTISGGGLIYAKDSTLEIQVSQLREGWTWGYGGAVQFIDESGAGALRMTKGGTVLDSYAALGGGGVAVRTVLPDSFTFAGVHFEGNESEYGGALSVNPDTLTGLGGGELIACNFIGNRAEAGGALDLRGQVLVKRVGFCGNEGAIGSALYAEGDGAVDVTNSLFLENVSSKAGAAAVLADEMTVVFRHDHFLGNQGVPVSAVDFTGGPAGWLVFRDNLVAFNEAIGSPEETFAVRIQGEADHVDVHHDAWFDNGGDYSAPAAQSDAVYGDPLVRDWVRDGRCGRDEALISWYSPLRDAGSQGGPLPGPSDHDGTRTDIGAWGGADADEYIWWFDTDQDGSVAVYDCDDENPAVWPGAEDEPYDGVDADCDLWSDGDADRDGFDALFAGGLDCDDTDPTAWPGALELPYDGVDQDSGEDLDDVDRDGFDHLVDCDDGDPAIYPGAFDDDPQVDRDCDGVIDVRKPLIPQGCSTPGGPTGWSGVWLAVVIALSGRARRERSPG